MRKIFINIKKKLEFDGRFHITAERLTFEGKKLGAQTLVRPQKRGQSECVWGRELGKIQNYTNEKIYLCNRNEYRCVKRPPLAQRRSNAGDKLSIQSKRLSTRYQRYLTPKRATLANHWHAQGTGPGGWPSLRYSAHGQHWGPDIFVISITSPGTFSATTVNAEQALFWTHRFSFQFQRTSSLCK